MKKFFIACAAVLSVAALSSCGSNDNKQNPNATAPVVVEGGLKVAFIDTDTLLANYEYAKEMDKSIRDFGEQQKRYGQQQVESFQKDYQDYMKNGSSLTYSQQKAKESELSQRGEKLQTLEQELMAKIAEKQSAETLKVMNAILAYVREYNEANQKFDIILTKSATLYVNPAMDITKEIVDGLNEDYKKGNTANKE